MPRLLTEMMRDYFGGSEQSDPMDAVLGGSHEPPGRLPVVAHRADAWSLERDPRRLVRSYEFSDPRTASEFVSELLAHEAETGHHARITCEFPLVTVEVRTHDLNDVTELDQEYARTCDLAYDDVLHYGRGGEDVEW